MKGNESKTVTTNWLLWLVAALVYPLAHWIPTSTGHPPRIYDVLIPVFMMGLGYVSYLLLLAASKGREGK